MGTEIFKIEEEVTEKMKPNVASTPSKNKQNSLLTIHIHCTFFVESSGFFRPPLPLPVCQVVMPRSAGCLKNGILWKNCHNYPQTHPKCKSWRCFGKFRIFATMWALRFSKLKKKWLRKLVLKLATPPWKIGRIHSLQYAFLWCSVAYSWLVKLAPCVARRLKEDNFVSLSWCV